MVPRRQQVTDSVRSPEYRGFDDHRELDETAVLSSLEADLGFDDDRRRIVGLGNGLFVGLFLWAAMLAALYFII